MVEESRQLKRASGLLVTGSKDMRKVELKQRCGRDQRNRPAFPVSAFLPHIFRTPVAVLILILVIYIMAN